MGTRGNDVNAALASSAANVLQMIMQRQQLAMEAERLDFAKEQFTEEQRMNAFQRIGTLIPLSKPGEANPLLVDELQAIFPEQERGVIEELVAVPETMENVLRPALIERFQGLEPEARDRVLEMGLNRAILGEATTDEAIALQDDIIGTQLQSIQNLIRDPKLMEGIGRKILGMDVPVRFNFGGREVSFDTADAARLSVEIWKHNDMMNWYRSQAKMDATAKSDIAGELIKLAGDKGIGISRAGAMSIINTIHWMPDGAERMSPEQLENLRKQKITETLSQMSPEMQTVAQMYMNGAKLADEVPSFIMEQFPGIGQFLELGSQLEGVVGKETAAQILPILSKEMGRRGQGIARPRLFGFDLGTVQAIDLSKDAAKADMHRYIKGDISSAELTKKWGATKARAIIQDATRAK